LFFCGVRWKSPGATVTDPDLVSYDGNGRPETVRYHLVNALLLSEVQNGIERSSNRKPRSKY
jgi:hypothetical protein